MRNKNFFYALTTLVGMIIGVGIFGLPYAIAQAGFFIGFFYLILLGGAVLLIHLFYGEIVLRTNGQHRLVGYAEKYLGPRGKKIAAAVIIFEFYGAMLAYLIAGGYFLSLIFGGGEFIWVIAFFVIGSLAILLGLKTIASSEFFMTIFLLAIAAIFILKGAPLVNLANLSGTNFAKFFLPYGVILFSLTGGAAIPEMRQILGNEGYRLKKVIILGTIIPAIIYLLFAFVVVGVAGLNTPENAAEFFSSQFGRWVAISVGAFGFFAVVTSYLVVGLNLRRVFQLDYKINKILAWALACFVPFLGYLLGISDFLFVIGLIGAIAGGFEGIMTILIWRKARKKGEREPEYSLKLNKVIVYGMILLFVLGIAYQFIYLAK